MATRVNRTIGLSTISETTLLNRLRRRYPRREGESNFIGLKRSNALSDLDSPSRSLDNVLDKISQLDVSERNQYGSSYKGEDWAVTDNFIDEQIDNSFLSQLAGTSVGGGVLGSTVSITPRIRIEDRISAANSFYGEGSFPGLHSGPDAQFYRNPSPERIGYIRFIFSGSTVEVLEITGLDGITPLTEQDILGSESSVVLDLDSYELPGSTEVINLSGSNISLRLVSTDSVWTVEEGVDSLTSIRSLIGAGTLSNSKFLLSRPYSVKNLPLWYTSDPGEIVSGGPDDIDPVTSARVLESTDGVLKPLILKGYWYGREYVENRWTSTEQALIGENSITEDSNIRWFDNPAPLRGEQYNWGIRWDGYLRITAGNYAFQVQTNVDVKIDMGVGSSSPYWVNVFDTRINSARQNEDTYVSFQTFGTDDIDSSFKYITGSGANDWVAYVPLTIRLFRGGPDKSERGLTVPTEPNVFIKTTSLSSPTSYYSEDIVVDLSGTDGNWSVGGDSVQRVIDILQDTEASVAYGLVGRGESIFTLPVLLGAGDLTIDGSSVSLSTTGLEADTYTLRVYPVRSSGFENNLTALWKGRIASPSFNHQSYSDMVDGSFTPDQQKVPFDSRPDWWRITEGHPYDRNATVSGNNTPLDGLIRNSFRTSLQSVAPGVGLYGNGSGTYSNKPNIILGEARYDSEDTKGSNYIGLRLVPNRLGEGGRVILSGFPVNNSTFNGINTLVANDLGGDPNHKTLSFSNSESRIIRLYLDIPTNKYYLHVNPNTVTNNDNPVDLGLPSFSDAAWLSPISIIATQVANDLAFTTNVRSFVSPLSLSVERVTVNTYTILAFSTTLASLLVGGAEVSSFSTKYVRYYTEENIAFQYGFVDTGEGLSFSDVLKFTYNGSVFNSALSEVPKPPSDRVTPFGFDLPEFGGGLCYPPYATSNPILSITAVTDEQLYNNLPAGNYDVLWGDHTKPGLGGNTLTITEKIEFSGISAIVPVSSDNPIILTSSDYTHRTKIETALDVNIYDEDVLEHIGNEEKVKDSYYVYVTLDG